MKQLFTILLTFSFAAFCLAQNGINYKALIKDPNGNVVNSSPVNIEFFIYEGAALNTIVYDESHITNTDANGFIVVNIGEGTSNDDFNAINWSDDQHFLNVLIDIGTGIIDQGITPFTAVPYALSAANVNGLEALDEGFGIGYRFIGKNPNNYGNIGFSAVDLSYSSFPSDAHGATGLGSIASGINNIASGGASGVFGDNNIASGTNTVAMGESSNALGYNSFAIGSGVTSDGFYSVAFGAGTNTNGNVSSAFGTYTKADAYSTTVLGSYNIGGGSPLSWVLTEPLFEIGNGTSESDRNNALTVLKNGKTGIGTHTPNHDLSVSGQLNLNEDLSGSRVALRVYGDEALWYNGTYFSWGFGASHNYFSRNIGINDTTPDARLHINASDDVELNTVNNGLLLLGSNFAKNIAIDNNEIMARNNGAASELRLQENGGDVLVGGAIVQTSDQRLKKDIEPISFGLEEILSLNAKQYNWKDREIKTHKSLGLIAQDVQKILPNLVNENQESHMLSVNYIELIPILIKASQDQQEIIDKQQLKINKQDNFINQILERIEALESKN